MFGACEGHKGPYSPSTALSAAREAQDHSRSPLDQEKPPGTL